MLCAFDELIKADIHAKGLQLEYMVQMASHRSPLPVLEFVNPLALNTFTIDFSFRIFMPERTWLDRLRLKLGLSKRLPEGIYLEPVGKNEAQLSFSIKMDAESRNKPVIEPLLNETINYYVVTEAG